MTARHALLLLALVGCAGCRSKPPEQPVPLDVELSGCADVLAGPRCLMPQGGGRVCLWVDVSPGTQVEAQAGSVKVTCGAPVAEGGVGCCMDVPAGAETLVVTSAGARPGRHEARLGTVDPCSAADEAKAHRAAGRTAEGLARLALGETRTASCVAEVAGLRARLTLDGDDTEEGIRLLQAALVLRKEAGSVAGFVNDSLALAHTLTYRVRRTAEAREVIAVAAKETARGPYDEGIARVPYYEGRLMLETGNLRAALGRLRDADLRTGRLGLAVLRGHVREGMAVVLQILGRPSEAAALLGSLPTNDLPSCERARVLNIIAWLRLLQAEADGAGDDPRPPLREAIDLVASSCTDPSLHANVLLNQALAALQRDQLEEASALLVKVRVVQPTPDEYVAEWLRDAEGQIALRRGEPTAALRIFEALAEDAPSFSSGRWRAELGKGQALQAMKRLEEAAAAFDRAEGLLEEQALLVPLGEGRTSFLGGHEMGARLLVDLLIELGRPEEALRAARRARARVLAAVQRIDRLAQLDDAGRAAFERGLDAYRGARAELTALRARSEDATQEELDGLRAREAGLEASARQVLDLAFAGAGMPPTRADRPLAPGEVLLAYHPVREGWAGFASAAEGITVTRLPALAPKATPEDQARALLLPFKAAITGARRVRILATGPLREVDFHALPWEKSVLGAHVAVAYGLDLPPSGGRAGSGGALVVADPGGNLRGAREDGELVARTLHGAGGAVQTLSGAQATRTALLEGLPKARLFHYAGHAVAEGRDGFGSALVLAGDDQFTVGDILTLRAVPEVVVLAACRSGRDDAAGRVESLGLAQAFLAAGSSAVIAATRPVDDACAARLTASLYEHVPGPSDAPERLEDAQSVLRREAPGCDWSSFRALTP